MSKDFKKKEIFINYQEKSITKIYITLKFRQKISRQKEGNLREKKKKLVENISNHSYNNITKLF